MADPMASSLAVENRTPPLFPPELSDRANARREINQSKSQAFHRNGFCNMTFSEDITHSSLEKLQRNPNPTYIDLEAGKLRSVSLNQDVKMLHSQ